MIIGIHYIVACLKHTTQDDGWFEQPLFPDVEIITRNNDFFISKERLKSFEGFVKKDINFKSQGVKGIWK